MDARQGKVAPPRFEPVLVEDGLKVGYCWTRWTSTATAALT
jgi:hypothetical protein